MLRALLVTFLLIAGPSAAGAGTLRIATYDVGLSRDGPGLLLAELEGEPEPQTLAVAEVIRAARPDVLLLTGFDHDLRGRALDAFRALLRTGPDGIHYPEAFAAPGNTGRPSGLDLDDDGRLMGPGDALGWGRFPGDGGMALLSRLPIDAAAARSFAMLRWADVPGALLPVRADGSPYPDAARRAGLRLSSRAHWDVPVVLPDGGRLHVLASNPTPPLFDGPEAFNARRNHDEIGFWRAYLAGTPFEDDTGRRGGAPEAPLVVLGNLNLDPADGAGMRAAIAGLLADPRLSDPAPSSAGGAAAAGPGHRGDPELDTADWREEGGPGNLRVDYVLPSVELEVTGSGVFWPAPGTPLAKAAAAASAHRLVWVDLALR
jgi:hypothetical protein